MNIVILIIGNVLTILFVILLFKGSRYDYMLDSLEGEAFPFKTIYSVGLAWQDFKIGTLKGNIGDNLRKETLLMYSKQYSEFYARIIWAQVLSFGHICLAVSFLLAGMMSGSMMTFFVIIGVVACLLLSYYFYTFTKDKIKTRQSECEREFPNSISKLALLVNSGIILHEAWEMVAYGKDGVLYDLMKDVCIKINNGKSEIDAISEFGILTNSDDIKKFTSALIQSIERGGGDLPQFLENQSSELWARKRQQMLQKGEKAAGALLMPIALMFFGIMLIIISAAMQSFTM